MIDLGKNTEFAVEMTGRRFVLASFFPQPAGRKRRFDGRLMLTNPAGETVYEKNIRFDDLDDHGENADELARRVGEILERIPVAGR